MSASTSASKSPLKRILQTVWLRHPVARVTSMNEISSRRPETAERHKGSKAVSNGVKDGHQRELREEHLKASKGIKQPEKQQKKFSEELKQTDEA